MVYTELSGQLIQRNCYFLQVIGSKSDSTEKDRNIMNKGCLKKIKKMLWGWKKGQREKVNTLKMWDGYRLFFDLKVGREGGEG